MEEAIKLYLAPTELSLPKTGQVGRGNDRVSAAHRLTADQVIKVLRQHRFALAAQTRSH